MGKCLEDADSHPEASWDQSRGSMLLAGGRRQTRTFSAVAGSSLVIFMVLRSRSYCSQIARTVAEPDFFRGGADFDDGEGWRIFSLRDWFVVYGQKIEQ